MESTKITDLKILPYFDLEEFMNLCKETRLDGEAMEELGRLWTQWLPLLKTLQLERGKNSWLAVWLPEEVENAVDEAWGASPSRGYLVNALAQYLCMAAVQQAVPQVGEGGCAPSPRPTPSFRLAMEDGGPGFAAGESGSLARRYAVITYYPFGGGCEICGLSESCPRIRGENFATVVLPGHERDAGD